MKEPRIRLGMVGGGEGAFIGAVHRIAARIDDHYELVAGAFSSDADRSKSSGAGLGVSEDRSYASYAEMARKEAKREDGIEAVAIVTPNHLHYPVAKAFLKQGIHVICDKPLTATPTHARAMAKAVKESGALFVLTHNYSGYPMIRQARQMIADGALGKLRVIHAEYVQDWLSEPVDNKQADWRTDPERSGAGGATGDIGTHAYHLAGYVSGLKATELCADLDSFVKGRKVDDNGHVMLRYRGGAKGMLWCSQVCPGNENGLTLRVYGEKGGFEWAQENPNNLWYTPLGEPKRLLTRGGAGSTEDNLRVTRIPPGHPEGYLEGFATIYAEAAEAIYVRRTGKKRPPKEVQFPDINDGLAGVTFVDACVRSSKRNGAWIKL